MRKRVLLGVLLVLCAIWGAEAKAQNVVKQGVGLVNIGIGIDSNAFPISFSYDYGLNGHLWDTKSALSVGVLGGAAFGNDYTGFYIGPRLGVHYHFMPQLDTYFAFMLGYNVHKHDDSGKDGVYTGKFRPGGHIGARYFFTPNIGAFAELGYGYSILNVGVTFLL